MLRPGERLLRVVGARGSHPGGDTLVGQVMTADQFPPTALTDPRSLTVVVPVAFGRSDRGFLVVRGLVDTRATSTRAKWARVTAASPASCLASS